MQTNTLTPPLASISWGQTRLPDNEIAVYFATAGEQFAEYTAEDFTLYEKARFLDALSTISAVIDVTFTQTDEADAAEFVMVLDEDEFNDDGVGGQMNPPGEEFAGVGEFNALSGDYTPGGTLERGGSEFLVLVHEFLHGMGLAHPHDEGGGSTIMAGVSDAFDDLGEFDLNQGIYTVMTYNDGYHAGVPSTLLSDDGLYGGTLGPSALDIGVLQLLYGANTTTGSGDTVYTMPEANVAGTGWLAIWDVGGTDEIRYDGTDSSMIDLRAATLEQEIGGGGWISAAAGIAGGFTIAHDVVIENATSGGGNDTLMGNDADNTLSGNAGADTIMGGSGADTLSGGAGDDMLDGGEGQDRLNGGDGTDILIGGDADDFLFGGLSTADLRDMIYGGDGNDNIDGGYGNDELRGDAGNDTIAGGFGADTVIGGAGDDLLTGSAFGDRIFGNDGSDFINGGFGFDRVTGGADADRFFHLGVQNHGSDWIQDYDAAEGDVLMFGGGPATADDFLIQRASTPTAGSAAVQEIFVTQISTGNLLWALVDGDAQAQINIQIQGEVFDLLS